MSGTSNRLAISARRSAIVIVNSCDSMTHGPAIQVRGWPLPHITLPILTAIAGLRSLSCSGKINQRHRWEKSDPAQSTYPASPTAFAGLLQIRLTQPPKFYCLHADSSVGTIDFAIVVADLR
jgi:hypothetical protein